MTAKKREGSTGPTGAPGSSDQQRGTGPTEANPDENTPQANAEKLAKEEAQKKAKAKGVDEDYSGGPEGQNVTYNVDVTGVAGDDTETDYSKGMGEGQ